jgi:hypothetical protein
MMKPTSMEKMQEMVCLVSLQVKSADAQWITDTKVVEK